MIVPEFDFRQAAALSVEERLAVSVRRARELLDRSGYQHYCSFPCIPPGATAAELAELESDLGISLPDEYRRFLTLHRYLKIDDGCEIGGLAHEAMYVTEVPWLSNQHQEGSIYLVFAQYWRFADGDQLMFDLSNPTRPVIAYLHEHGPAFEVYAPSFSLALWRLVHEL